jgi:hypothetical protein
MKQRIAILLAVALAGAIAGGAVAFQYLLWRVYMAEGLRDMYMIAAADAAQKCSEPQPGKWPR